MKFNSMTFKTTSLLLGLASVMMFILGLYGFLNKEIVIEWESMSVSSMKIPLLLLFDMISMIFFSTVLLIASAVMMYSSTYMMNDNYSNRFSQIVIFFILSMMLLIFSPSLISVLLGWDGLGVTSYLLVNYYMSEKSYNASMLTCLTNRMGDVMIILSIALCFPLFYMNFSLISCSSNYSFLILLLIITASMTKSAQLPFSAWLPAAMAAPTPVSSLVHSSTLVTAGVYLLIRFNFIMYQFKLSTLCLIFGVMTMFMAGCAAIMELDMKKIIALSTLSQLGVMFFSLGINQITLTFFHLICHAYFKAMMFMVAGWMIHSMKDYQDMRKMGGAFYSPIMMMIFLVSSISLCGLPFMTGFYSKDFILEMMFLSKLSTMATLMVVMATMMTAIYSLRSLLTLFKFNSNQESFTLTADVPSSMTMSVMLLFLPSIAGGYWLTGMMPFYNLVYLPTWVKNLTLISIFLSFMIMNGLMNFVKPKKHMTSGFHLMWFVPITLSFYLSEKSLCYSKNFIKLSELTWSEWVLGGFLAKLNSNLFMNTMVTSNIMMSLFIMTIMMILI